MIIVGLTGGIATGKSTVSSILIKHGIPVIDADQIARDVVKPHTLGLTEVIDAFGLRYLKRDGTLDRDALGLFVFSHAYALKQLNEIMLPLIRKEAEQQLEGLRVAGHSLACYSAALIIENRQVGKYRPLIVVHCTPQQQLERLMGRGLTTEQAMHRMECQMPVEEKLRHADLAIDTTLDKSYSASQTEGIVIYLKQLAKS